ncbi:MAG: hypothetical protein AB7O97_11915 [Planctomycetota bacterium]
MKPAPARFPGSLLLAPVLVLLGACQSLEPDTDADTGVSAVQFQDLVVPAGMSMIDRYHESHSREDAGWRYGHFEYLGAPQLDEACAHLLSRMPQHNWQLAADEATDASSRRLRFERGRYVVDYNLTRIDGVTRMVVDYRTEIENR